MRPGKFLKRLIKPISDEAVDAALAEREAAKNAESMSVPVLDEMPPLESKEPELEQLEVDSETEDEQPEQIAREDSAERMFASDEELRETGIDVIDLSNDSENPNQTQ